MPTTYLRHICFLMAARSRFTHRSRLSIHSGSYWTITSDSTSGCWRIGSTTRQLSHMGSASNTSDCEPGARSVVALGTEGHLRSIGVATVSAWIAHAFAWAAGVFFAFGPVYQGESVTPALPGAPGGEVIPSSATAIEVNGLHVILLLLVPILLTAITLLGLRLQQTTMRKILLWSPAVVLLGFCFVAIASIGMFYLPTALALLVAAIADLGGQEGNEPI